MAAMFSCTVPFRSSYFWNTWVKSFMVFERMKKSATPRMTSATRKMMLILKLMKTHISTERIMLNGALTEMRISIWKAFCRFETSVVRRVMSPEVENLSMLENEKV